MMKSREPTYSLRIEIVDGTNEITPHAIQAQMLSGPLCHSSRKYFKDGKTGCDEVLAAVDFTAGDRRLAWVCGVICSALVFNAMFIYLHPITGQEFMGGVAVTMSGIGACIVSLLALCRHGRKPTDLEKKDFEEFCKSKQS